MDEDDFISTEVLEAYLDIATDDMPPGEGKVDVVRMARPDLKKIVLAALEGREDRGDL